MTRQESFKTRIRQRMDKTGERYNAARRALITQSHPERKRVWAAEPDTSNETIRDATGRGWDEWCDVIDAWPGHEGGHTAIARYVHEVHGVDGWWAQNVTVGYERITGIRLPYQQPDGTFSAGKARTVTADIAMLREMLLDDADRADLFPGLDTELRSRPGTKVPRIAIGPGVAQISLEPAGEGRVKVSISHDKLPESGDVEEWKAYWSDWLEAIDEA